MALTPEAVKAIANEEDLKKLRVLNLDSLKLSKGFKLLVLETGAHLQMLSLRNNLFRQLTIPLGFSSLRKLDLSSNQLMFVGPRSLWNTMPRLEILYLHDNLLESWDTLEALSGLPGILHLTLFNNLVVHLSNYRPFILSQLPTLLALDFLVSTHEERAGYSVPLTNAAKVWVQDTPDVQSLKAHVYRLRRKWERSSPCVRIQSLWRRYWVRKHTGEHLTDKDLYAIKIQKVVRGWQLRRRLRNDLENYLREIDEEHLLYTPENYQKQLAVRIIEAFAQSRFLIRKRRFEKRTAAAIRIQTAYRRWITQKKAVPFLDNLKFYVLKSQQRTLICLLKALSRVSEAYHPARSVKDRAIPEFFESKRGLDEEFEFPALYDKIVDCESVKVIRLPDVDSLKYSTNPYYQFTNWMCQAKIANNQPAFTGLVSELYREQTDKEVLDKFKVRGCSLSLKERRKLAQTKLVLDDYLDLVEFEAPSQRFLYRLYELVLEYNHCAKQNGHSIFLPLFSGLLDRVRAACTIQAGWRASRDRRRLMRDAILRRSVYCLQRWSTSFRFHRRMHFLCELKTLLLTVTSPVLYLQEHFFQHLIVSEPCGLSMKEQQFGFYCKPDGLYVNYRNDRRQLLPQWVGVRFNEDQTGGINASEEEKTLQAAVLSGARIELVSLKSQLSRTASVADANLKFLRLEYASVGEAKNRLAVVFLKTLDHSNNSYIPLFPLSVLEHDFLMTRLRKVWQPRRMDPTQPCPATSILQRALAPPTPPYPLITPAPLHLEPEATPMLDTFKTQAVSTEESVAEPSLEDLTLTKVHALKEELARRRKKLAERLDAEHDQRQRVFREQREAHLEQLTARSVQDSKAYELKRSLIHAQKEKRKQLESERLFVNQFAQARNMLQKITKRSDIQRWRHKSEADTQQRVQEFKQRSWDRRELVQSIMYEKFKAKQRQAAS